MKRTKENNALALQSMENLQSALNLSVATKAVTIPKFTLNLFDTLLKNSTDKISLTKRLYILPLQR